MVTETPGSRFAAVLSWEKTWLLEITRRIFVLHGFHVSSDKKMAFGFSKNVRSQGEKSCLQDCDIAFGYLFKSTAKTYFGSLGNLFWLVV
jgi:hypothetical protein